MTIIIFNHLELTEVQKLALKIISYPLFLAAIWNTQDLDFCPKLKIMNFTPSIHVIIEIQKWKEKNNHHDYKSFMLYHDPVLWNYKYI